MADNGTDWSGLLGLLGAAALSSAGAIYNNRVNRKLQQSINTDVVNLANTAHQREVADLYAAGLNPILSATGSGAPTPSLGTPHQDNVLSDFGSSARAMGDMISRNRKLSNDALSEDVRGSEIANDIAAKTKQADISSAIAEAHARQEQAEYENTIARDRNAALDKLRHEYIVSGWDGMDVKTMRPSYLEQIKDSVEADLSRPSREATQSWINSASKAADTVLNGTRTVIDAKRGGKRTVTMDGTRTININHRWRKK